MNTKYSAYGKYSEKKDEKKEDDALELERQILEESRVQLKVAGYPTCSSIDMVLYRLSAEDYFKFISWCSLRCKQIKYHNSDADRIKVERSCRNNATDLRLDTLGTISNYARIICPEFRGEQ